MAIEPDCRIRDETEMAIRFTTGSVIRSLETLEPPSSWSKRPTLLPHHPLYPLKICPDEMATGHSRFTRASTYLVEQKQSVGGYWSSQDLRHQNLAQHPHSYLLLTSYRFQSVSQVSRQFLTETKSSVLAVAPKGRPSGIIKNTAPLYRRN